MGCAELGYQGCDMGSPEADAHVDTHTAHQFAVLRQRVFEFGEFGGDSR